MEWSKESCLNLINEYQKYPVLWNPKDLMYFSKNKKIDAWAQIGRNLNIDTEEAKKKNDKFIGIVSPREGQN